MILRIITSSVRFHDPIVSKSKGLNLMFNRADASLYILRRTRRNLTETICSFGLPISKHWFQCWDFSCYTHQWPLKGCYLQHGGQTNILFSSLMAITGRSNFSISSRMAKHLCFTIPSFVLHRNVRNESWALENLEKILRHQSKE